MANKIKCTCGHSWDKSDSSKKDATVCHICGKDNAMKNGGWLDNYGEEANANEGHSSAPKEWMGEGYSNVGRDYSPAWGGQFQGGGSIGTNPEDLDIKEIDAWEKAYTNSPRFAELSRKQGDSPEMTQNRIGAINTFNINKDIIRIPEGASNVNDGKFYLSPEKGDWPNYSDINAHEFGHLPYNTENLNFPKNIFEEIQFRNKEFQKMKKTGKVNENIEHDIHPNEVRADKNQLLFQLQKLGIYDATKDGDIKQEQLDKFKKSGEWNRLQRLYSDEDMLWLINNVAKNDSGVSNTAKMGGSLPGSVGFMYARTNSPAPSEGPYAKKTLPSAQNGQEMSYYKNGLDWKPKSMQVGGTTEPGEDDDAAKKENAKKIVEIARRRIANNDYVEVPEDIKQASYAEGKNPYGCIGGVCTVAKEAGALPRVYWSNTGFAKDAPNLGFPNNGYGLRGIQNLEPGDFVQYLTEPEGKDEEGNAKYIPRHAQIFLGVNPDTKEYEFFDNQNKALMSYPESLIKDKLKNTKNSYDYGAVIYKNNPFHPTANSFTEETLQEATNRIASGEKELKTPTKYKYSVRSDAKDYNNDTKDVMNTFVNYANDDNRLNNLVSKLGTDKEEIHDSLLNVFGELGQENNWSDSGKGVKSKLENIAEKTMAFFGGGKNYSIGPGQNKFSSIPKDLREKFGIKSTKDLYDLEKVIPLMVGQDILNKKTLRYWGENNLLSDKLIGHTDNVTPLTADDLKGGVGRWSPYLRNEYGLISTNKRLINNNDLIPFNTEVVPNYDPVTGMFMNPRILDEGSYPDKIFHKTDDNLQRELIIPSSEKSPDELSPFTVISKKKDGGDVPKNQNAQYVLPRASSESTSLGAPRRDVELLNELARRQAFEKLANQPSVGPAPFQTIDDKRKTKEKKKQIVRNNPNIKLDENDDIVLTNPDRGFEGQPLTPNAKRFDKGMGHIMNALEATSALTGAGQISSNLLRLGASQLEKKIGRNLVSRNLKNFTSNINPTLNAIDEAGAYVQLDPIGIMGNRLNSRFYNPTTALNTANNTVTGVKNNLTNSAVEASDLILGENNLRNLTGSPVENAIPSFQSEINWGNWNSEIPSNQALMQEYNTIEQTSKANGNWMKNPDGSPFQGTPEQFVQQNSENFKKAFGNSKLINSDGSPTIQYHGSAKNFDIFDESKFQLGDAGYSGSGIYTTPDKGKASSYALSSKSIHTGEYQPTVYELYGQGNNPISAEDLIKQNKDYDLFNFHRAKNWQGDVPLEQQMLDYDVAIRNQTRGIERVSPWNQAAELVFPTNKQLKSAVGNNGMFDMTNPNIYKSVISGLGLGTMGAAALEQKKEGGVVKDNRGYWNPDNWGKVVEIDSPDITMEDVYEPLIGESKQTGERKLMLPGKNYKFANTKQVIERPIGKNGVNQQDEKVYEQLDQLTNFTNYNKPTKGGWLDKYN